MKAFDILSQAAAEQSQRATFYDAPQGERSMAKTVAMFNVLHGTQLTEVQGWQFMEILKMVRSSQGALRVDNFIDSASYASLAGEAASAAAAVFQEPSVEGPPEPAKPTKPTKPARKPAAKRGRK